MTPKCSIIIPVFGRSPLTRQCLESVFATRPKVSHEIIVVDDASQDDTQEVLQTYGSLVRVLSHRSNAGFATACNTGAAAARSDYLVFLNNDTVATSGWLDSLEDTMTRDEQGCVAAVGSKLLYPDDTIQHAGVVIRQDGYPWHIYAGFPSNHSATNKTRKFQIVTAASALFRRSAFEKAGGFDSSFHNGYEDVDLCLRLGSKGYDIVYCHESVLYHLESVTRAGRPEDMDRNTLLYRERWLPRVRPDDVQYYLEDGLFQIEYNSVYPLTFIISPTLGLSGSQPQPVERQLAERTRQTFELLQENIRLTVKLAEKVGQKEKGRIFEAASTQESEIDPELLSNGSLFSLNGASSEAAVVSVIIPAKNAGPELAELIEVLQAQNCEARLQIVVIDSGSTDGSLNLLLEAGCRVLRVSESSFDHGLTRNLAAKFADGKILVFLTQTARPVGIDWLQKLTAPLLDENRIAAVCSRIIPHQDADLLSRLDGEHDPSGSDLRSIRKIHDWARYSRLDTHELRLLINFHTVSSAIRSSVFRKIPFRRVTTIGEDILWAKEALEAGYAILHEPDSVVRHSHDYSPVEIFQRSFDDGVANHEIVGRPMSTEDVLPLVLRLVEKDRKALAQQGLTGESNEELLIRSCLRRTAEIAGQWCGINRVDLLDDPLSLFSLTHRIRRGLVSRQHGKRREVDHQDSAPGRLE